TWSPVNCPCSSLRTYRLSPAWGSISSRFRIVTTSEHDGGIRRADGMAPSFLAEPARGWDRYFGAPEASLGPALAAVIPAFALLDMSSESIAKTAPLTNGMLTPTLARRNELHVGPIIRPSVPADCAIPSMDPCCSSPTSLETTLDIEGFVSETPMPSSDRPA